ncbi:hypothetical protein G6O69_20365 [Pseudenhygromyxa sp. WMMC2535]|uniref:hypothetical protein n=1 Tax=Pseudenhygromyxa sp. WMMC2535 TaxID=2712867 RepID=UPI001555A10E|nr:hypothetical protein [Pseudenhygromyxa sp. WMMC2535]NVB40208.1 hypothetical protein [Pseudenhygromyxa sp. WMMC2535]
MKRFAFVSSLVLPCLLLGCPADPGGEDTDDGTGSTDDEAGESTDEGTTEAGETTDDDGSTDTAEDLATITGVILDMQGAALPTPGVQLCGPIDDEGNVEACIPVSVDDSSGAFSIGAKKTGLWSLKVVHGSVDDRNFAGQAFQVTLSEGDALDFSDPAIVIPEVSATTVLDGLTQVNLDGGLSLSIDPEQAQTPDFLAPTALGGLVVDPQFWRVDEVEGAAVIQAWAFSPFGTKAKDEGSFDFSVDDSLGLDAGTALNFYEIEKDNGSLHLVATGVVNADASAVDLSAAGEGLHELTWLLVTED